MADGVAAAATVRIVLFESDPSVLLVASDEEVVELPAFKPPFTRDSVVAAIVKARGRLGEFRITVQAFAGRYTKAAREAMASVRAARSQQVREKEASVHTLMLSANETYEQQRAQLCIHKEEVDARIRGVKQQIADAKAKAFETGRYMERSEFRELELLLAKLQSESLGVQGCLREMRERRAAVVQSTDERRFIEIAKATLALGGMSSQPATKL